MRKLAISDIDLLKIEAPARYIGGELNSIIKDKSKIDIRFCMCFPDVYEIGMSHLGIQILYDMFNKMDDVWCERVYSPWPDAHKLLKDKNIPLFALESQEPIKNFDFLGITLQYEMCYTNVLQILDLSQIPIYSKDRGDDMPLVIGGGPCTYNPEPIADFFDIFYIGEGETMYKKLLDLYRECRKTGYSRKDFLKKAAKLSGIYVPSMYEVKYNDDFTINEFKPISEDIPSTVNKEIQAEMTDSVYPEAAVVPFIRATQDRVVLEIQRGCIRGCRFCQAGMIYRPLREKNVEKLKEQAKLLLKNTGYDEISLSSLSSSDYSQLKELVDFLVEYCAKQHVNISLPSLRIDAFALDVMSKVQDIKKSSLTFAPEAGSQRMRDVINKGLTEEVILNGARLAFEGGWNKVKLYFMLGLPGETDEDVKAIPILSNRIAAEYYETVPKEKRQGRVNITSSSSFFVPKPFTPFQWAKMNTMEEFLRKARLCSDTFKEQLNYKSLRYTHHDSGTTILEGVFARGDRRISKVIKEAYDNGCLFDAWTEYFDYDKWLSAFEKCGIDFEFYIFRERSKDEILPWDFINAGVSRKFLWDEWENSKAEKVTPNCRMACNGCGAAKYKGGVCFEAKN